MEPPEPVFGQIISLTAGISLRREVPAFFVPFFPVPAGLSDVRTETILIPILVISNIGIRDH